MSPQETVRAQARDALKHNYARALTALVTALLPVVMIDAASGAIINSLFALGSASNTINVLNIVLIDPLILIAGILLSPFLNGYIRVYYKNAFTGEMDLGDLFCYFESGRYANTLVLNLNLILRLLLPAFFCYAPVILYIVICSEMDNGFFGCVLYNDFYVILWILSAVILTLYSLRYFTVFTLYVENESLSVSDLFRTSKQIMRGQSGDAAKLIFSYTPWMLLCITVLPLLYVVPYMTQGLCIGAKWMTRAAFAAYEEKE